MTSERPALSRWSKGPYVLAQSIRLMPWSMAWSMVRCASASSAWPRNPRPRASRADLDAGLSEVHVFHKVGPLPAGTSRKRFPGAQGTIRNASTIIAILRYSWERLEADPIRTCSLHTGGIDPCKPSTWLHPGPSSLSGLGLSRREEGRDFPYLFFGRVLIRLTKVGPRLNRSPGIVERALGVGGGVDPHPKCLPSRSS